MTWFSARFLYVVLSGLHDMERNAALEGWQIGDGIKLPDTQVPRDKIGNFEFFLDLAEQECQRFGLDEIILDRIQRTRSA